MAFSTALEPRPGRSEVRTLYDSFEIFGKEGTWTYIVGRLSRLPESLRGIILPHFKLCGFAGFNSHASLAIRAKKKGSECGSCFWSLPQSRSLRRRGRTIGGAMATWSIKQRRACVAVRTTVMGRHGGRPSLNLRAKSPATGGKRDPHRRRKRSPRFKSADGSTEQSKSSPSHDQGLC